MNSYLYLRDINDNCVASAVNNLTYINCVLALFYWFMFYLQLFVFTKQDAMTSQLKYSSLLHTTLRTVNTKLKSSLCKEFNLFYCCLYLGVF